jgi:UPF0755 protein
MTIRWWRWIAALIVCALALSIAGYVLLQRYLDEPLPLPTAGHELTLARGDSLSSLVYSLAADELIKEPRLLLAYSRLVGRGAVIAAGDYWLEYGITPRLLLQKLERGDVRYYQLTLVEGWTLTQVLQQLRLTAGLQQLIPAGANTITAQMIGLNEETRPLEGLLFPDTYRYQSSSSDVQVLQQAYRRLQSVLLQEWQSRAPELPYETPYEALIMASLIEKETGLASERSQIAGVFVRRLKLGMRLQTDPTIIYGLGASFDGNLRSRHLKDSSNPYNTYRHNGLPPTPIALVGREAIHAALHPEEGDALYFVAKGDGSHYFSASLEEHRQAVKKYQIYQRRKDYSSAPGAKSSS